MRCTKTAFTCGSDKQEIVTQYVYLVFVLTEHLDYGIMAKNVANSASRGLGLMICKFKEAGGLPFSASTKLYDSAMWSIINYGATVRGCKTFSSISAVQNRALRFIFGIGRYAPNAAFIGDTGWESVTVKQYNAVRKQWYKLNFMESNRLNHKIFNSSLCKRL